MSAPRGNNDAKVHSVFYSYKGVWTDDLEENDDPIAKPTPAQEARNRQRKASERKVRVDIYVHKKTDTNGTVTPPFPISHIEFEMRCEEVEQKIVEESRGKRALSFSGTDIETVRKAMWGALDRKFETKWDRFILVEVEVGRTFSSNDGSRIDLEWRDVWRGTAWDGTLLLREYEYHRGGYKVCPWPGEFKDADGKILALIEETPENEAALEDFKKRFNDVGEAIKQMLTPKNIAKTFSALAQARNLPLLPFQTGGKK